MVNAQEWLDKNYPQGKCIDRWGGKANRSEVEEIFIKEQLERELDLKDFTYKNYASPSVIEIFISHLVDTNQFQIINQPKRVEIIKSFDNPTKYLENQEKYNTKEKRNQAKELYIGRKNLEGYLDLSDFINLEKLNCAWNKLTSLNLTNCVNLKELECSVNQLSHLDLSQNTKLEKLWIGSNKFVAENPTWLSHLVSLKELNLTRNNFVGSLKFVENMNKLEELTISETNLTADLEYLPLSLKEIARNGNIGTKLKFYNYDLALWKQFHSDLMQQSHQEPVTLDYAGVEPEKVTTGPEFLQEELNREITLSENYNSTLNYSDFLFRDGRPFIWEDSSETDSQKQLPLRLYNLQTNQVEETAGKKNIPNYLALSYCWGTEWEKQPRSYGQSYQTDLTKLGRKALNKVIATWKLINPDQEKNLNYIWIDNFCINQSDVQEKGQEVANQRHYYNNSTATLIAVDNEIGKEVDKENKYELTKYIIEKIVTSPWFKRSWTFQEGLLSKQTIFMFDDKVVDGRILALAWGVWQRELRESTSVYSVRLNTTPQIFITPLGWSYGAKEGQIVNLTLGEALLSVKHRKQTVPIDGIYSVLGLLPYGNQVETKYKGKLCLTCKEQETNLKESVSCEHPEKTEWPTYFEEYLEHSLAGVVKEVINHGHGQEIFSWFGSQSSNSTWPIIPQIRESGSTKIEKLSDYLLKNMQITLQGIQLENKLYKIDEIFPRDKDGKLPIKTKGNKFILKGYPEILEKIKVGDSLIIIGEKENDYLTILVSKDTNYPISLVEFELEVVSNKLASSSQKIFADLVNRRIICSSENILDYQALSEKEDNQSVLTKLLERNKWRIIHHGFTQELVRQWKNNKFSYEQIYEWASAFKDSFHPQKIDFYLWLRDNKQLTAKEFEKASSELRNQLIIYCWYSQFSSSQLYGISDKSPESFNDLITIGSILNWTKIEAVLIREIQTSFWISGHSSETTSIQFTYQVKSNGEWKIIKGERHGQIFEENKVSTTKLENGEYLTKIEGWKDGNDIKALSFHTINSIGKEKVHNSCGIVGEGEKFSLPIDNNKQASIFYGKANSYLKSLGIQQTPHQLTNKDLDLIAQIQIPPK